MVKFCDASAVSPRKGGPVREPQYLYAVHDWTRQGTEGFLGHRRCQGQTSGSWARRHEALILMGDWCGALEPTPQAWKHGCVSDGRAGVECAERNATKKMSKVVWGRGIASWLEPSNGWLFRCAVSTKFHAGFRRIPHEST